MIRPRPFRFGVIVYQAKSKDEWVAKAQRAENLGYSTFLVPDHLEDQLAAVPALVAAAEATSSIRLGSSVFDNDFRHPVMLAKEAATIDLLSGGRFELGIGAGRRNPSTNMLAFPLMQEASVLVGWKRRSTSSRDCLPGNP